VRAAILWTAGLDVAPQQLAGLELLLSNDEQAREMRYRTSIDCRRYVVRRALLRIGLGRLVGAPPQRISFGYEATGRPYINAPSGARGLRFSLAHSDGIAVSGCAFGREIGSSGLRSPLHDFDVAFGVDERHQLPRVGGNNSETSRWRMEELPVRRARSERWSWSDRSQHPRRRE
jgi:hypothetical protein